MALKYTAGKPDSQSFTVPAGEYKLRVIEADEDTSKSGNDMIKLKLRIVKSDGRDGPAMFDYLVFSDSSFWKIDAFLKAAGEHPGEGEEVSIDCTAIIGWEVQARLTVDTYNGKQSNKVDAYLFDDEF